MAENQQMLESRFIPHAAESEQCPKGFACTGPGEDQHISGVNTVVLESTSQQMNQLLLPQSRLDLGTTAACRQREGRGFDDGTAEDESF